MFSHPPRRLSYDAISRRALITVAICLLAMAASAVCADDLPPPPQIEAAGARYLKLVAQPWSQPIALQVLGFPCSFFTSPCPGVDCPAVDCVIGYVQPDGLLGPSPIFRPWEEWGTVFVRGAEIVPDASYTARAVDPIQGPGPALAVVKTYRWGDTDGDCDVDMADLNCILDAFAGNVSGACTLQSADLRQTADPCEPPDQLVNIFDLLAALDGFAGAPFPCPFPCSPRLTAISPAIQRVHDLLTLRGEGFGSFVAGSSRVVVFDGTTTFEAGTPEVWRDDFIQVRMPVGDLIGGSPTPLSDGQLFLKVETAGGPTNFLSLRLAQPQSALAFRELTQIVGDRDVSQVLGSPSFNLARTKDGEVGDVDGDGRPDLIDNNSNNRRNSTHGVVRLNQGDGTFAAIELEPIDAFDMGGPFFTTIRAGGTFIGDAVTYDSDLVDLTNDGLPELVQALAGAPTHKIRVLFNLRGSGFVDLTRSWITSPQGPPGFPDDVAHTDVDQDGFVDVAVGLRFTSSAQILRNQGGSTFAAPITVSITDDPAPDPTIEAQARHGAVGDAIQQRLTASNPSVHDVFFVDADVDGLPDVVLVDENSRSQLFLNDGAMPPSFVPRQKFRGSGFLSFAGEAADLNADGLPDLAIVGSTGVAGLADLYLNDASNPGIFTRVALPSPGPGLLYDLEFGDLDLDGDIDMIAASIVRNAEQAIVIWLNDGGGGFTELTAGGASTVLPGLAPYERLSADLIDFDLDGDLDLYVTGADGQSVQGGGFGMVPNQLFENLVIP